MDAAPAIHAAESSALWRSAKHWLLVWTSAGFKPRVADGKLLLPQAWAEKFPDGPGIVEALRTEITALVRDGNKAVLDDPRLKLAYPQYVADRLAAEETRLAHAERCVIRARREIEKLKAELQTRGAA